MRLTALLALLLTASARAQVVPIAGRVSTPASGANAGIAAPAGSSAVELAGSFLAPALSAPGGLPAPAIAPLEAAAVRPVTAAGAKAVRAKDSAPAAALTPAALAPAAVLETKAAAKTTDLPALSRALAAAAKDADGKKEPEEDGSAKTPGPDGKADLDGRPLFDGAAKRPDETNEPTQEELEAAFGASRRPAKTFLKKFGVATVLLAANSVAYAAVPNDGTETGTLAHLSFDTKGFLDAVHHFSFSGLAESAGRAFTSMFMHANAAHIVGNMVMLLLYAPWVQSALGARRTMTIYLGGGLAAAVAYALLGPAGLLLGASGAIAALMGASLTIWRKPKGDEALDIASFFFAGLAAFLLFNEVKSLIFQGPASSEHVATLAHVVGAAVGLLIGGWYALRRATSAGRSSSPSGPERPEGS